MIEPKDIHELLEQTTQAGYKIEILNADICITLSDGYQIFLENVMDIGAMYITVMGILIDRYGEKINSQ